MIRLMSTPREVEIAITSSCNLRCKYCSHFTSYSDVNTDLPTEEWLIFFKELNKYTVLSVTLGGGEPFLRKDIRETLEGIIKNNMRFGILTNGTLIKEDISIFLGSTNRLNFVQVSIDGFHFNKEKRYAQGRDSAKGYYEDSYDELAFVEKVLISSQAEKPNIKIATHDLITDKYLNLDPIETPNDSIIITDGAYLFKANYRKHWDI